MSSYISILKVLKMPLSVILSFVIAVVLAIAPLPEALIFFRPEWVVLLLICWVLKFPFRVGFTAALLLGFFLDSLYNFPLGIHSLALILIVYLLIKLKRRFDFFSSWQKVAIIFGLVFLYELPSLFYELAILRPIDFRIYFIPVITSALIWPVIGLLLDVYCEKLNLQSG